MHEKILAWKEKEREAQADRDKRIEQEIRHREKVKRLDYFKAQHLRRASKYDYEDWLELWLEDNDITYYYDYNFPVGNYYIATSDFILNDAYYGALSFNIIVPKGIKYEIKKIGHCNIYDMNNIKCIGDWIPCYNDIDI
jgi:hypothetical protein